jgi:hypothetical protein
MRATSQRIDLDIKYLTKSSDMNQSSLHLKAE